MSRELWRYGFPVIIFAIILYVRRRYGPTTTTSLSHFSFVLPWLMWNRAFVGVNSCWANDGRTSRCRNCVTWITDTVSMIWWNSKSRTQMLLKSVDNSLFSIERECDTRIECTRVSLQILHPIAIECVKILQNLLEQIVHFIWFRN